MTTTNKMEGKQSTVEGRILENGYKILSSEFFDIGVNWIKLHPWYSLSCGTFLLVLTGPLLLALGLFLSFSSCLMVGFALIEIVSIGFGLAFLLPVAGFAALFSFWLTVIVACGYNVIMVLSKYYDQQITYANQGALAENETGRMDSPESIGETHGFDVVTKDRLDS